MLVFEFPIPTVRPHTRLNTAIAGYHSVPDVESEINVFSREFGFGETSYHWSKTIIPHM